MWKVAWMCLNCKIAWLMLKKPFAKFTLLFWLSLTPVKFASTCQPKNFWIRTWAITLCIVTAIKIQIGNQRCRILLRWNRWDRPALSSMYQMQKATSKQLINLQRCIPCSIKLYIDEEAGTIEAGFLNSLPDKDNLTQVFVWYAHAHADL